MYFLYFCIGQPAGQYNNCIGWSCVGRSAVHHVRFLCLASNIISASVRSKPLSACTGREREGLRRVQEAEPPIPFARRRRLLRWSLSLQEAPADDFEQKGSSIFRWTSSDEKRNAQPERLRRAESRRRKRRESGEWGNTPAMHRGIHPFKLCPNRNICPLTSKHSKGGGRGTVFYQWLKAHEYTLQAKPPTTPPGNPVPLTPEKLVPP